MVVVRQSRHHEAAGVNHDTTAADGTTRAADDAATLLLDLDGLQVEQVERDPEGTRLVRVVTADETARACPTCGVISQQVKDVVWTRPRDLPFGPRGMRLVWQKRRWCCAEPLCPRDSFTESLPAVPARARITTRLRCEAGDRVKDGTCATVVAAGRQLGLSWPTVMDALRERAAPLLDGPPDPVEVLGIDEVRRGRPRWRPAGDRQGDQPATAATTSPDPAAEPVPPTAPQPLAGEPVPEQPGAGEPVAAEPVAAEPVAAEPVAGQRGAGQRGAGESVMSPSPASPPAGETAKARVLADRWHVGFTDLGGGQGMLGQVEGRTADDVAYWLAMQPAAWRDRVRYVAIDMCSVFVSAIRRYLPGATIVVDHFHVVKLANDTVAEVRRRVTTTLRGRRGRDSDPEWKIRNLLGRNRENLTDKAFTRLWNTLIDLGGPGITILKAWIAKEKLRALLALAGTHPDRSVISQRLYRFYTWCADAGIPELERLATTISTWWPCIEAFLHTKITNAASEGYNRVVKLDARNAFGYRNPENQRLRTRCATTRRARGCFDPG